MFGLAGLLKLVGEENIFESNHGAVRYLEVRNMCVGRLDVILFVRVR